MVKNVINKFKHNSTGSFSLIYTTLILQQLDAVPFEGDGNIKFKVMQLLKCCFLKKIMLMGVGYLTTSIN